MVNGLKEHGAWWDLKLVLYLITTLMGSLGVGIGVWQWQRAVNQAAQMTVRIPSPEPFSSVVVEVNGAVTHPGVYTLQYGDRVAQAIEMAGAFLPTADALYIARDLPLAEPVTDGQKIFVPFAKEQVSAADGSSIATSSSALNLNLATMQELESLPGIGPTKAEKIQAARPITTFQQLVDQQVLTSKEIDVIQKISTL